MLNNMENNIVKSKFIPRSVRCCGFKTKGLPAPRQEEAAEVGSKNWVCVGPCVCEP